MALNKQPENPILEYFSVLDEQWHDLKFGRNGNCALGSTDGKIFNRYFNKGFVRACGAKKPLNETMSRVMAAIKPARHKRT